MSSASPMSLVLAMDDLRAMGGVQRVVRDLADGFADRDIDVRLWGLFGCPSLPPMTHRHPAAESVVHDQETSLLYSPTSGWQRSKLRLRGQHQGIRAFDDGVRRVRELLRENPRAVVIACQLRVAEYLHAAGAPADRLVIQYHGSYEAAVTHKDLPRIRRLAPHAAAVLALNEWDASALRRAGVARARAMRNPVDVATLTAVTAPGGREPVVVAAGRFDHEKAYHVLIEAWSRIERQHPAWRLELHGDGPLRQELAELSGRLTSRADVRGPTARLQETFARSSLHALSSTHEGMGLVIAEAMCAGLPTVATDCGAGVRELVRPGTSGELVPVGDVGALAQALHRYLREPELRRDQGASALSLVKAYDRDAVIDDWLELLGRR